MLVTQSCLTLCDSMDCSPPGPSVHGILPHKYWSGYWSGYALLQGIFWTQGSNVGLLHGTQILYSLSHQGSPNFLYKALFNCQEKLLCEKTAAQYDDIYIFLKSKAIK